MAYQVYVTSGIRDICGYKKSYNDLYEKSIKEAKKTQISSDLEPEDVIANIKAKLRGNHGCNEPSGETVTE